MSNPLYVLVQVTYDRPQRHQVNIEAARTWEELRALHEDMPAPPRGARMFGPWLQLYRYAADSKLAQDLDKEESNHYWIQQFGTDDNYFPKCGEL